MNRIVRGALTERVIFGQRPEGEGEVRFRQRDRISKCKGSEQDCARVCSRNIKEV